MRCLPAAREQVWVDVCSTPATADNSNNAVIAPLALSSTTHPKLYMQELGTLVQVRLKYDDGATPNQDPVVQLFGVDSNGSPERLKDLDGNHELTLADATTDAHDGTWKFTDSKEVDANGATYIIVAIKLPLTVSGGSTTGATIQARIK